jgi:hypothetical protein
VQALACGAALAMATPAVPQGQGQAQNPPTIKTEVSLVNLFATVRDKNKRVVTDLKQENFKISEDGHDEKIAFFSREMMLPITLGLLLDTSGSEHARRHSGRGGPLPAPCSPQGRRSHGHFLRHGCGLAL